MKFWPATAKLPVKVLLIDTHIGYSTTKLNFDQGQFSNEGLIVTKLSTVEETTNNREITSNNINQGDIIDMNKGEVTQKHWNKSR